MNERVSIVGYTMHNGVHHTFSGTVQMLDGSLRFESYGHGKAPFTLPVEQVVSVDTVQGNRVGTLAVVVVAVAVVVYFLGIIAGGSFRP